MPETNTSAMPPSMTTMLHILSSDRGASVVELAERGRLGRSTAAKVLTALEARGLARRQSAEPASKRSPDLWFATTPPASAQAEPANASHTPALENPAADKVPGSTTAAARHGDTHDQAANASVGANDAVEPETALDGEVEPDTTTNTTTHADDAPAPDNPAPAGGSAPAATAPQRTSAETAAPTRLAKGGLRALVIDYLTAHPGEELTAPKIGKSLGRSSGAVANALDTLVKNGQAELTREKPRTFRHRPAQNAS